MRFWCRYCSWTGYQLRALIIHWKAFHSIQGQRISIAKNGPGVHVGGGGKQNWEDDMPDDREAYYNERAEQMP